MPHDKTSSAALFDTFSESRESNIAQRPDGAPAPLADDVRLPAKH
ncbi:MAG: hypothetical protein ACR2LK_04765 [Solirubrobacteraceae bacterium]